MPIKVSKTVVLAEIKGEIEVMDKRIIMFINKNAIPYSPHDWSIDDFHAKELKGMKEKRADLFKKYVEVNENEV